MSVQVQEISLTFLDNINTRLFWGDTFWYWGTLRNVYTWLQDITQPSNHDKVKHTVEYWESKSSPAQMSSGNKRLVTFHRILVW